MLPSGTVTFLFTDIEGSTSLWETHPQAMRSALARHDSLLQKEIERFQGTVVKSTGDGMLAVFPFAASAEYMEYGLHCSSVIHPWTTVFRSTDLRWQQRLDLFPN